MHTQTHIPTSHRTHTRRTHTEIKCSVKAKAPAQPSRAAKTQARLVLQAQAKLESHHSCSSSSSYIYTYTYTHTTHTQINTGRESVSTFKRQKHFILVQLYCQILVFVTFALSTQVTGALADLNTGKKPENMRLNTH